MTTVLVVALAWLALDLLIVAVMATAKPRKARREARWARQCAEKIIQELHKEGSKA